LAILKNHTFHDAVTTNGNGNDLAFGGNISANAILVISISGTSAARTITFKGLDLNGNYVDILATNLVSAATATSTAGVNNEQWRVNVSGLVGFRCVLTNIAGGNLTVKGRLIS
jgi:hypothetical protein